MDIRVYLPSIVNVKNLLSKDSSSGFTLLESLVVILLIGILATVGIPSWLTFVNIRRLETSQNQVYYAMRQAQSQATKDKLTRQVSFRIQNGVVQWAVHEAESGQFVSDAVRNNSSIWYELEANIRIDKEENNKGKKETTLRKHTSEQVWRVLFNYQGCPIYEVGDECTSTSLRTLGQITLYSQNDVKAKRCVYVSTILGAIKTGNDHLRANENDKYCY
ncbi:prepilin-type N-terminal cleavage/methylation domain-containing protein [Nostoc sp. KVJ3]|uniref:pilus assembly FimT family protein n=1 Tax=Nostoc sp. KVJ3 TaxID=457945 RepID=UPI0022390214|nr:type II secretion system protein [Nostoc sp. KVJ3]MCW5313727.1 prepilin-type N-terminal cleavage/methylation domain-containing protein [Nostoc sp. KVJ3]